MIIGLCSSYKEGPLVQGAVRSLLAFCDRVLIFEGAAGEPLGSGAPESDFGPWADWPDTTIRHGVWATDAKKRTAMVEACRPFTEPTWGVWLDGDEIMVNGEYLPDWIRWFDWQEEETGRANMGWPIKLVEMDGSIAICQAKVLRIDRLDSYSVSSSVFKNTLGELEGRGNYRAHATEFPVGAQLRQLGDRDGGYLFAWPPLPCEPHIFHRSALRHPRRVGLRMHEQEAVELEKAKLG